MSALLQELNETQRQAVTHTTGPVLVIAGPGSGKTRVLTYRIAHLIESGVAPWEILALTFTNKAAKEMKERISKVVGDRGNKVWAGTFHSIFARILRAEAEHIGFPSDFTIYDAQDAQAAINQIVKQLGLDAKAYPGSAVYSRISLAKNNLVTPERYKRDAQRLLHDKQDKRPELYQIYEAYAKQCRRSGAMDFDDLLLNLHALFAQKPEVLDKYRRRCRFLQVDEFQDTNTLQYAIVQQLVNYPGSPRNICVVGDDAQSIYGFRGATIQNILDFERDYPDLSVYKLEQNYRSTRAIVEAANEVIRYNRKQLKKTIFTQKDSGDPIRVIKAMTDEEEGKRVVDSIQEQKSRAHLKNQDFAILYRTNAQSRIFEEALTHHRIPYKVYGGLSFYQRKEVKDFLAYLRVAVNPQDEEALRRIINYPRRGIGDTTIDKLSAFAAANNIPLWQVLKQPQSAGIPARAAASVSEFVLLIEETMGQLSLSNAYDFALHVGRRSGMLVELKNDTSPEGISRFENATALLDGIKAFVDEDRPVAEGGDPDDRSLRAYLQNVALLTDFDSEEGEDDRVKLMSVHSAKGLEFPSVFVVGLEENLFPSSMALQSSDVGSALDEERRLFYVAITRAEKLLTLSYSVSRYRFGKMAYNEKSRFLAEIGSHNVETPAPRAVSTGSGSRTSGVSGLSRPPALKQYAPLPADQLKGFAPSPPALVKPGAKVLHERFGQGEVVAVDGGPANRVATIRFDHAEAGEKRIMLQYARLMVLP
jgi:DNA helicase-2/ATP-dependent DNA helicase PcrA